MDKVVADLKIQAIMFDMSIDWELLELVPKIDYVTPVWLEKWNNRFNDGDNDPSDPEQNWEEDNYGKR